MSTKYDEVLDILNSDKKESIEHLLGEAKGKHLALTKDQIQDLLDERDQMWILKLNDLISVMKNEKKGN